jgi:hypothetical protein
MPFEGFYQVPLTEKDPIYTEVQPVMNSFRVPLFVQRAIQEIQQTEILDFSFFNIEGVRGYYKIDENGKKIRLVNAEDIARGAGLVKVDKKFFSEKSENRVYTSIRWKEFNEYAQSRLPYLQKYADSIIFNYIQFPLNKESFIPIELAVQIIMCADSEQAKDFQALVSIKIAKEIDMLLDEKYSEELNRLRKDNNDLQYSVDRCKDRIDTLEYELERAEKPLVRYNDYRK